MEEKQINLVASWDEVSGRDGNTKYFKPTKDEMYRIVIDGVSLEKKAFRGEPMKLTASCQLKTINGKPSELIWETRSFSIMKELKRHVSKEGKWEGSHITFLLKKKMEGDKTTYIFEELETNQNL